jgi:hypothetical protein
MCICGSLGVFLAIAHEPLNGAERPHSILVERPRKIKQRCGKLVTLPSHHWPDRDLALEDETGAVRREALLGEIGLDELLNVRSEVLW